MTTICWDGKVLAADRMATYGDFKHPVTKIWRLPDGSLVGGAGEYSFILAMVEWLGDGGRASEFPASQRDKDDWQPILHITTSGKVHIYERTPFPLRSHATQFAVGNDCPAPRDSGGCGEPGNCRDGGPGHHDR